MSSNEIEEYKKTAKNIILKQYVPFYQVWINTAAGYTRLPAFIVPMLFSAIPYFVGLLFVYLLREGCQDYSKFWIRVNISGIIAGMFYFMSYIYLKTLSYLDEFLFVLTTQEQVDVVTKTYRLIFKSPLQIIHCILWGVVTTVSVLIMGIPLSTGGAIYVTAAAFFVGILLGTGVWYTISISILIRKFCRFQDIRLNLLDPSRTVGIREIANLLSIWTVCLVFQVLLVLLGLFWANWSHGKAIIDFLHLFWTTYLILIVVYTFVYPHVEIKNIIRMGKRRGAMLYQEQMEQFLSQYGSHTADELDRKKKELEILSQYHDIYLSIIKSPSMAIDISIVGRFLSAMIVPLIITAIQHPQYFHDIYVFFKSIFV